MNGSEPRNLLPPLLLLLIFDRPGHGYDLIERLGGLGAADVEPGHVYRVLRGMERDHSVVSTWETPGTGPARRRYELTVKGRADLEAWVERLSQLGTVIDACLARWAQASASHRRLGSAGQPALTR
jgi:poly-beta-hydroxybutyrate-responsive repressor